MADAAPDKRGYGHSRETTRDQTYSVRRVFHSMREVCETYWPQRHAEKKCGCYPQPKRGVLVIQPRSGRQIRVI